MSPTDIFLLRLLMPGPRPSEIGRWVRTHCAYATVLVLTAHDRDCFLAQAIEAGVAGFLTLDAIRRAARGAVFIASG
ncbi:MAG: response regulator transcription factor [Thermoflexales bacterium]|nr:response regulator transcription factor [Thermoflexales bacterium]